MHAERDFGSIAPGLRADLLLLDGNPLDDVANADRISGVMLRGRWLDEHARAKLLAGAEQAMQGHVDPFAHAPPLVFDGRVEHAATYAVSWKGVSGTLLSGDSISATADIPEDAVLGMDHFLASKILLLPAITKLAVGESTRVRQCDVVLGSSVSTPARDAKVTRVSEFRFEIAQGKGAADLLTVDSDARIVDYSITSFGVQFERVALTSERR